MGPHLAAVSIPSPPIQNLQEVRELQNEGVMDDGSGIGRASEPERPREMSDTATIISTGQIRKSKKVARRTRASCGGESIIPTMPYELIFEILLRLPPFIIYSRMRFVCKSWCKMVEDPDFINARLCRSSGFSLLAPRYQASSKTKELELLEIDYRNDNCQRIKSKEWNDILRTENSCDGLVLREWKKIFRMEDRGFVYDSCDGLVLICSWQPQILYRVLNPLTNQHVEFTRPRHSNSGLSDSLCAIACAKLSREYKVVYASVSASAPLKYSISIYTLGLGNDWRSIKTGHISHGDAFGPRKSAVSVEGFVYFHGNDLVLLALDVESEKIHLICAPGEYVGRPEKSYIAYIKSESFLVFVFYKNAIFDFWRLEDPVRGAWKQMYQVDLNGEREKYVLRNVTKGLRGLTPIVFLEEDVILFRATHSRSYVVYRVKTRTLFRFGALRLHSYCWVVHKNSFVKLK